VNDKRRITKYRHINTLGFKDRFRNQLVPPPQERLIAVFTHCTGDQPGKNMPGSVILS
jgi:hypothetical protein